jgi:hypothetical protein
MKPQNCPFCGSPAYYEIHWITCENLDCAFTGPTNVDEEEAILAWNRIQLAPAEKGEGK